MESVRAGERLGEGVLKESHDHLLARHPGIGKVGGK